MIQQASLFGAVFEQSLVTSVDVSTRPFTVTTNTTTIKTHTIILATGADSKWLGVAGENDLRGGGVSTCATCDGFLYRDQEVVVIGGGDTAMEDALVRPSTRCHGWLSCWIPLAALFSPMSPIPCCTHACAIRARNRHASQPPLCSRGCRAVHCERLPNTHSRLTAM
jgi:hypothetical protein